jgi:hypothetical protein
MDFIEIKGLTDKWFLIGLLLAMILIDEENVSVT